MISTLWGARSVSENKNYGIIAALAHKSRDHPMYAPSQWETSLQCNNVSHWLGTYLDWFLKSIILMGLHKKWHFTTNELLQMHSIMQKRHKLENFIVRCGQHIKVEIKWPSFCRYFQKYFVKGKTCRLIRTSLKFVPKISPGHLRVKQNTTRGIHYLLASASGWEHIMGVWDCNNT